MYGWLLRLSRWAALVGLACLGLCAGCEPEGDVKLPELELWLGEPVESISAVSERWDWPRLDHDSLMPAFASADDHRLLLYLPGGQRFAVTATTVFLGQDEGHLRKVSITPRPELFKPKYSKLLPFDQVIAEAERLARELGLEDEQRFRRKLECWKKRRLKPGKPGASFMDVIDLSKKKCATLIQNRRRS